jgi:hypothetical protein
VVHRVGDIAPSAAQWAATALARAPLLPGVGHGMTHHEARCWAAKPYHGSGDFFRFTEAPDGFLRHHPPDDPQCHFSRQRRVAVDQVGKGGAAHVRLQTGSVPLLVTGRGLA